MTDLEIIKACAEKMGIKVDGDHKVILVPEWNGVRYVAKEYDPLHDDAQAMALVKKLGLVVEPLYDAESGVWGVFSKTTIAQNADLNRAICECAAKL